MTERDGERKIVKWKEEKKKGREEGGGRVRGKEERKQIFFEVISSYCVLLSVI